MTPMKVSLKFKTGFSVRSGYGLSGVVDGVIMRDRRRLPFIPGTTIKGILRQSCEDLAIIKKYSVYENEVSEIKELLDANKDPASLENWSEISRIFGSPFCPPLFQIQSTYLCSDDPEELSAMERMSTWVESHNAICPDTGTALKDHLFTNEIAARTDSLAGVQAYRFEFDILPKAKGIPEKLTSLLICGIRFADRMGANKSRGKGVLEMSLNEPYENRSLLEWINLTFPSKEIGS